MKKTVSLLIVPIFVLSIISGLLFNQLIVVQKENSELKDELFEVNTQLKEEQNQSLQLENQATELQNQINELEEQISKVTNIVKIKEFQVTGFDPIAGMLCNSHFDLTIENFGINDVKNLSISILTVNDEPVLITFNAELNSEILIDSLRVQEELKINGTIGYILGTNTSPFTVRLMIDDVILDENTCKTIS